MARRLVLLWSCCAFAIACDADQGALGGSSTCEIGDEGCLPADLLGRCADFEPLRQPFFGDTHVHTALSLDANLQGTRPGPDEAYAFARGEPIGVQPYDFDGNPLPDRPVDFVMLSDHAEYIGAIALCTDPNSPGFDREVSGASNAVSCAEYRNALQSLEGDRAVFVALNALTSESPNDVRYPELCGDLRGGDCIEAGTDVWAQVWKSASVAYDRTESCEFTSFVGYEWTAGPGTRNLHRNVIFRNDTVPERPISYFDEPHVEDLWAALREQCIDAGTGCDAIAIPHNSNLSGGAMFENAMKDGSPFDAEYAEERRTLEPIIEIFQHKGDSECAPGESISDEMCGFEYLPFSNLAEANLELFATPAPSSFVRWAFGEGMRIQEELGANPFQAGVISATDTHIAAPAYDNEKTFLGHGGAGQANREPPPPEGFPDILYLNPGGPGGVWAEENSRNAIFDALARRETFGTSGPRIVPRVFAGWDLPADLCDSPDLAEVGYDRGVPMGGVLTDPPAGGAPRFVLSAKQDSMGAPLQNVQVVKGWIEEGEHRVQIYEVAGDAQSDATVDLATCEPQGSGFSELCTFWEDPAFDPTQRAYYYVRVFETPTCRWSTRQCVEGGYDCENPTTALDRDCCDPTAGLDVGFCDRVAGSLEPEQAACCRADSPISNEEVRFCAAVAARVGDSEGEGADRCCLPRVEPTIRERAWTSPIWFEPTQ